MIDGEQRRVMVELGSGIDEVNELELDVDAETKDD